MTSTSGPSGGPGRSGDRTHEGCRDGGRTAAPASRSYLDHAATSPLRPGALAAVVATGAVANPAAVHTAGRRARAMLDDAREQIASLLGVRPLEIVLTSGGTEADTLALLGAGGAGTVGISAVEHAAIAGLTAPGLMGERARVLPVDADGVVDPSSIAALDAPGLVSVMTANNETGTLEPVAECARQAHRAGALFHTDAVQALGHLPVELAEWDVDLASFSAHKLGGPVGIGALWVRRGVTVAPVAAGGRQEAGLRSGTQMVALARGFAAALDEAVAEMGRRTELWGKLRSRLVEAAGAIEGVRVDGGDRVSAAVCHLSVAGARGENLQLLLDARGIDCSTGSACHAGVAAPSEVMLAMGRSRQQASSCLRFSFGPETTVAEIDRLAALLPEVVTQARAVR
ncbi:cysteine desulfurase family protein [Acidipropionibacterium jensenii]|uniref:cysteine desulfurase family protein n=2 Tax=Acidipropionibacterium jensenii TaxID=1749 RepID=UPI00110B4D8F|nr:cysteine desulfurase family protein [Acidipropionibacterium jensenii]MDN5977067.1 cysteine desulfurase [Acidipropionibacterium jensenii]MDN5995802.1 cysteine desulfurase [Acidipropionibacterium jensenii]MDN6426051.1 cysteine desulfurase [Acidipropionibacterium jensenii]MDN6513531.1 cysteine desulfurase [Acidipropionibacterium jensenii]MDN6591606.1 cysteine desulfurase [Acidipropionibacterium jensenii]